MNNKPAKNHDTVTKELPLELQQRIVLDVRSALAEDIGNGDLTAALVPAEQQATATVITRMAAVVAGGPWFSEVFRQLDRTIALEWRVKEGQSVTANTVLCELHGPAQALLSGERTALNFLQTLSATATAASAYAAAVDGTSAVILDTRKTLPGLRLAQKYAVRTGGAANHRTGLYDGILIKENHIAACNGIPAAVSAALAASNGALVEIEVESPDEAEAAMAAGVHRLLLDDFSLADIRKAVARRNRAYPGITLEASGGIRLDNVRQVAEAGVDFISVGSLTKDIKAIDLSMRFALQEGSGQ